MQPLILNDDFRYALDTLEKSGKPLFITGRAGTGKSTLLQLFRNTTRKKTVVLAPTGVAALNVGGMTIHSFFGFPPRPLTRQEIKKVRNYKLYKNIEVLIIDEISMVRADLLDQIDYFLRVNRQSSAPFGGVQIAFFGDLFQLPPVVASTFEQQLFSGGLYPSPYFFSAQVIREIELEMIELRQVYRQEQIHFLKLLDAIRLNHAGPDELEELNARCDPHFVPKEFYITLSARNATVQMINDREIAKLDTPARRYPAMISGSFNPGVYPTDPHLLLKKGAQVMFIKNDPEKRYVNGTIGMVARLEEDEIQVEVEDNRGKKELIEVEPASWEMLQFKQNPQIPHQIDTEIIGTFEQYPLKLAWAITIHKSQGKTFDRVLIDMGRGAFEHGQTYVALSRCRTLEGIVLSKPLQPQDVLVDPTVVEYFEYMRRNG